MSGLTDLWESPPEELALSRQDIHIWRASLELDVSSEARLAEILSPDERERAARFYFERDQKRFIAGRGILRTILSYYLDANPNQLRFSYGAHGKPALAGPETLDFNLAHSQGLALYAIARERRIGVDVEHVRTVSDAEEIAGRFFSPHENAVFRELPESLKQQGFFNCWTRKEAYIKAIGRGFAGPIDNFDVSLAPGEPAALLSIQGNSLAASDWSIQELKPGPGYVAAVATEGSGWQLACWRWSLEFKL